jgi:ribonucleoside-diphosphate reductase alpha chain
VEKVNFQHELANFIFVSKYSRYNKEKKRRETWEEAVTRLEKMHLKKFSYLSEEDKAKIVWAMDLVRQKRVAPSMRSLQFGGRAIEVNNARMYNCAARHIDSIRSFAEMFFLLLSGCGTTFGLTDFFLNRLPDLVEPSDMARNVITYTIEDTIEGWADSVEVLLMSFFKNTPLSGREVKFDYSRIRPEGAPLKTSGGKAPGFQGLKNAHKKIKALLNYVITVQKQTRLKTINAYDILMHCADAVLSGGVRRSACAVIFDKEDKDLLNAKTYFDVESYELNQNKDGSYSGSVTFQDPGYGVRKMQVKLTKFAHEYLVNSRKISWFDVHKHRARSNNSVLLLRDEVTLEQFKEVFQRTRQFGEPGFVFANHPWVLYNPCFEVSFIPVTKDGVTGVQFCNLTTANGKKITSEKDFLEVAEAEAILGTLQASYTEFPYLSPSAKQLTEEEALLGVSITGIMENPSITLNPELQRKAAKLVVKTNKIWAEKIGIKQAARTTLVKPEGTGSLVLETSSGITPYYSRRFFRRVQVNRIETPYMYFKSINPHMTEKSIWDANNTDDVITFPIEVSEKALTKDDLTALQHLELIKSTQLNWVNTGTTEANKKPITHNVSCTVIVKEDEWEDVLKYLYENRNYFAAVALLPSIGDKIYQQAPLQAVTTKEDEEKWEQIVKNYTVVDYRHLKEEDDNTAVQQEVVCGGGACEIPILTGD